MSNRNRHKPKKSDDKTNASEIINLITAAINLIAMIINLILMIHNN